jgi:ATP adenylyltransferase
MTYILGDEKPAGCIFCLAQDGKGSDDLVLGVGEKSLVMMNKYPYNNCHLLVAPRRHVSRLEALEPAELNDLIQLVTKATVAMGQLMNPEGFNVGLNLGRAAGAGIEEHLHFHVVPRWNGDTNFMTVLGEVRSIPEHIEASRDKLRPFFQDMA